MPVTKTAKRALRGSQRKEAVNKRVMKQLDVAVRKAKKSKTAENVRVAVSKVDTAVKKKIIHKNKAARMKSSLSKLLLKTKTETKVKSPVKKSKKGRK